MSIVVRQAVQSDIETLVPLFDSYRQFYGRESNLHGAREFLLTRFNYEESILFIVEETESSIGFAQLYPSFSSTSLAQTFLLNDLFVRESSRGKGVAKLLMAAVVAFAKSFGVARLTLSTGVNNSVAQALYRSCGWKRDEQFIVHHYTI